MVSSKLAPALAFVALATARDIPASVKKVYDSIVSQGECENILADGFLSIDDGDDSAHCPQTPAIGCSQRLTQF